MSDLKVFALFLFLLCGCTKTVIYRDEEMRARDLQDELEALRKADVTVDNFQLQGDIAWFSFSNGVEMGMDVSDIPLLSPGVQGYWRCNGVLTDVPLEAEGIGSFLLKDGVVRDRGYCVDAPENTLPAYRLSKLKGFHYVETDIRFTSDDVPVLIHDATVERVSDGSGAVNQLCFDEIRSLDFGGWKSDAFIGTKIPSLAEFLALCRDIDLRPYLELKAGSRPQVESVVNLVEEYGLQGETVYISFSSTLLEYVAEFDPTAAVGFLTSTVSDSAIQTALGLRNGSNYVFIDASDYSETAVSLCQSASIPLEVWTIDSQAVIKGLSPYISGVTSNRYHAGRVLEE